MSSKPIDPKRLKAATVELRADHRPRQLQHEPRLSRADERNLTDAARRRNGQVSRAELLAALATVTAELEFVKSRIGRVAPGDHRGYFREIEHGISGLQRAL